MGLFGPSKKEKALQAEIERLTGLLLPEQRDIENLNQQISNLKSTIAGLDKTINNNNEKIGALNTQVSKLDQEILEKRKQLARLKINRSYPQLTKAHKP